MRAIVLLQSLLLRHRPTARGAGRVPWAIAAVCALFVQSFEGSANAVGTRTFELDSLDELSGGDLKGTAVDSRGRVLAGFNLGALPLGDASSIWCALVQPADGAVLLGTANTGKIFRVANGQISPYAETGQLVVTSLVHAWNADLYASTIPNGRIVRIKPGGHVETFADLPAKHVWALVFDPARGGALYAATGPDGKLFRIDSAGKSQVYFDSEEPHLTSLAIASDGTIYAGSSGQALLYRITGPGRASVVYDLPGEEVRALLLGPRGDIYAISNEYGELPELQKRATGQNPASPVSAARPKPGKGTLTRVSVDGRPEKLLYRDDTHFVSLAIGDDGRAFVGTGAEGRVYAVDDAHTSALVADTDERQVSVLSLSGPKRFVATSDPPSFHEIKGVGGNDAVWTSKVFDAGLRARIGRVGFRSTGPIELSVRSGNTKVPDSTWSAWSAPMTQPSDPRVPPNRFVQVRARFAPDPNAVLSLVTIPFVTDNLRAIVTGVEAQPRNTSPSVREGQLVPTSGGEPPSHSSTVKLSWKVDNPDADPLRYRLSYKIEGQTLWRDLTRPDEPLSRTEHDWDTSTFPEGFYRVRVEATDETANPPDRVFRHTLESSVFVVDNTPPTFRALSGQARRIQGTIVDGVGPIARIDIAVDGRPEWRPFPPKDGIYDTREEEIDLDVAGLVGPGNHIVAVRAFDAAGNYVVKSVELK